MYFGLYKNFKPFITFIVLLLLPLCLTAKETIIWLHPDFAPSYILKGEYQGEGTIDNIHHQVFNHLTQYNHETRIANFKRIIKNISAKDQNCAIALLKNEERSKVVHYSVPHFLVHPVRLIIKKEHLFKFANYKEFDESYALKKILEDRKLLLGYSNGRSYSNALDNIINAYKNPKNAVATSQLKVFQELLKKLDSGHIDYTLGYSHELNYAIEELKLQNEFLSLPIYHANSLIPVYVGCPKNEWGEKIIQQLNTYLKLNRTDLSHYGAYLKWLNKEEKQNYEFLLNSYFNKLLK